MIKHRKGSCILVKPGTISAELSEEQVVPSKLRKASWRNEGYVKTQSISIDDFRSVLLSGISTSKQAEYWSFFFFFCLNRSKGWCSSGLQWIRWEMWKKTPGIGRSLSKGRTVLLAVWSFVMLTPRSCHKRRTAQVGGQDTQALSEQGKTEFGIQKGKAKNTGAVEKWRKLSKKFFPTILPADVDQK